MDLRVAEAIQRGDVIGEDQGMISKGEMIGKGLFELAGPVSGEEGMEA